MAMPGRGGAGILTCNIQNIDVLYTSYLPFIERGAIFVPSDRQHQLGQELFVAFTLTGSSERIPLNGKVVWLNQKPSAGRPAGFAIQFGNDVIGQQMKNEVERLLAGKLDSQQTTYTM